MGNFSNYKLASQKLTKKTQFPGLLTTLMTDKELYKKSHWEHTINKFINKLLGFLPSNKTIVFVDSKGSMTPFKDTVHNHIKDNFPNSKVLYFYNCPNKYFYKDWWQRESISREDVFESIDSRIRIIIYSDAGAARGGNSDGRFKPTLILTSVRDKRLRNCMV